MEWDTLYEWLSVSSSDLQSPALMKTSSLKVISHFASLKYFSKNKGSKYNIKYLDWCKKKLSREYTLKFIKNGLQTLQRITFTN